MQSYFQTPRKKYFAILLLLQFVILILLIVGGELTNALGSTIFRIIMLLAANYCLDNNFAIFYSLFVLYNALYLIDPIGLFVTGHSQKKGVQDVLCIVAFLLTLVASYLGYLYSKELAIQRQDSGNQRYQNFQNQQSFRPAPVNRPERPAQPSTSYGGTNYLYQNPPSNQQSNIRAPSNTNNNNFQAFSGQGYSLS